MKARAMMNARWCVGGCWVVVAAMACHLTAEAERDDRVISSPMLAPGRVASVNDSQLPVAELGAEKGSRARNTTREALRVIPWNWFHINLVRTAYAHELPRAADERQPEP